jgi:hypothetical protein
MTKGTKVSFLGLANGRSASVRISLIRLKGVLHKEYEVMFDNGERTWYLDTNLVPTATK